MPPLTSNRVASSFSGLSGGRQGRLPLGTGGIHTVTGALSDEAPLELGEEGTGRHDSSPAADEESSSCSSDIAGRNRRRHGGPSAAPVYSPPFGCGARKDRSGHTGARSKAGL